MPLSKSAVREKVICRHLPRVLSVSLTGIFIQLPQDLDTWRMPGTTYEDEEKIWQDLDQVFRDAGYILWPWRFCSTLVTPGKTIPLSSGFGYATPTRGISNEKSIAGTIKHLQHFDYIVSSLINLNHLSYINFSSA